MTAAPTGVAASGASTATTTDVSFTPLYGCYDDSGRGAGPVSSLLEVGGVTILLDCGWDINFDEQLLAPLAAVVSRVDLVLISHPDLEHLGGLPYAVGKLGLSAPIFATLPTTKMGQMAVYNAHQMRVAEAGAAFKTFSLDDVDAAFEKFKSLKYSQHLKFSEGGRGAGVTITPYAAGRLIGGSLWRICWQTEDNDIVYAVSYNHRREEHLNGGVLEQLSRPSVMITDAHNVLTVQSKPPRKRAADLIDTAMATVRQGGNVLLPCDTAGRTLELLLLLNMHWTQHRLGSYPLVLLHSMAFNTGEFAKSQLEWMSDALSRQFDLQRSNPFEMRHVTMAHTIEELDALPAGPKVVLATDLSLDYGFAKALLLRWAADPVNTVLLTQRGHGATVARELMRGVSAGIASSSVVGAGSSSSSGVEGASALQRVVVEVPIRVPLKGEELQLHIEEEARRRRQIAEEEEQKRQAVEMEQSQVLADSDDEDTATSVVTSATLQPAAKRRRVVNAGLLHKYSKPQHLMFGYHDAAVEVDEYGVREAEPIGWLAMSMQERNDTTDLLEEEGHRMMLEQHAVQEHKRRQTLAALGDTSALLAEDEEDPEAALAALAAAAAGYLHADSAFYADAGVLPTKLASEDREIEVRCRVVYIDMEGLSDGRSIKNLISTVGPKQLVIVGGGSSSVNALGDHAREKRAYGKVFAPASGEQVTVSLDTDVFEVLLHDALYTKLRWHSLKGYELAQIDCAVAQPSSTAIVSSSKSGENRPPPTLTAQQGVALGESGRPAVFVSFGDVQLTQLSSALKKAGMATTFAAAKLTVNGHIVVTKGKGGQLNIAGPLCADYFAVRSVLYKQYTIVS